MAGKGFEQDEELLVALRELSNAVYEDPGYHTPKNIFNPAMTRSIDRPNRSSIIQSKTSPSPVENPYSSLKKSKFKAIRSWDIEALVSKEIDLPLSDVPSRRSKTLSCVRRLLESFDACDYILGVALFLTVILFLIGIIVILS